MRLKNNVKHGKYYWRVILDTEKDSVNYIERVTGCYHNGDDHICLKCLSPVNWLYWQGDNRAKNTCSCGQKATLEIIPFLNVAYPV